VLLDRCHRGGPGRGSRGGEGADPVDPERVQGLWEYCLKQASGLSGLVVEQGKPVLVWHGASEFERIWSDEWVK
jgi:hypothetical protein